MLNAKDVNNLTWSSRRPRTRLLVCSLVLLLPCFLPAQSTLQIDFIGLEKFNILTQNSSSTPSTSTTYEFDFTTRVTTTGPGTYTGALTNTAGTVASGTVSTGTDTLTGYSSTFTNTTPHVADGTYTLAITDANTSTVYSTTLAFDPIARPGSGLSTFPDATPTITNGSWLGGALQVDNTLGGGYTLQFNSAGYNSWATGTNALNTNTGTQYYGGIVQFEVKDGSGNVVWSASKNKLSGDTLPTQFIIPQNTLTPGTTYYGELQYDRIADVQQGTSGTLLSHYGYSNSVSDQSILVAYYGNQTQFTISSLTAIPETASFGVGAGLLALGVAAGLRRRRAGS